MNCEWVELTVDDGTAMRAWVARPDDSPPSRGLLVFQEAFGVNAHIRDVTGRFADAGFLAIAPDMFHRTAPGFEASYTDFPAAMPHLQAITVPGLEADVRAAYRWLERAGVARQCGRGRVLLRRPCRVRRQHHRAAQGGGLYHGGNIPPLLGRTGQLAGPALFFWGGSITIFPTTSGAR